jgi:hypothetical protein
VAHLRDWERAWCRTYRLARHRRPQVARAPALAELAWTRPYTEQVAYGRFLLLPDPGGLSIPAFRAQLGRLVDRQWATGERLPVLVVATTSVDRVRAWTTLVERVSRMRGWTLLVANVTTWTAVGQDMTSSCPSIGAARNSAATWDWASPGSSESAACWATAAKFASESPDCLKTDRLEMMTPSGGLSSCVRFRMQGGRWPRASRPAQSDQRPVRAPD